MRRILYRPPTYINNSNNLIKFVPFIKNLVINDYKPSLKTVIIEVFYSVVFSHHLPNLIKGGGFFGNLNFINIDSLALFLQSYVGKILFYFIVFYLLHFIVIPKTRKIDFKKIYNNLNK